jgi:hypothetical protein
MDRLRKTKKKYERGRTRRSDEENLYYIIERDLEREALFPWNDGWISQVRVARESRKTIDYVVQYGERLIGIEVKFDFPKVKDFEQVQEYMEAGTLDGIFVAYPSDRVGEAVRLIENEDLEEFGLISIALFHSHIISKAKLSDRADEYIFDEHFDKEKKSGNSGMTTRKMSGGSKKTFYLENQIRHIKWIEMKERRLLFF